MRSQTPKVAHEILGRPMLGYVLAAARSLNPERLAVVVGHRADTVTPLLGEAVAVAQDQQLGTAHAVLCAQPALADFDGILLVVPGDTPLLTANTLMRLVEKHRESGAGATLLTACVPDPTGYGRIVRDPATSHVLKIVEQKDASAQEQTICEVNTGMYAFEAARLFAELGKVGRANAQGEFYLTDIVEVFRREGITVAAFETPDHRETLGVNSREQLAEALAVLQERINRGWMESGVTIVSPGQTFLGPDVSIGPDTVVWPGTIMEGRTVVGARCRIGPNVRIEGSVVGDDACVEFAVVRQSQLGQGAQVGPYASLRPGSVMADRSKAGTFVELKNAQVGADSKVPHLSYMGDAIIGRDVNIGAGSITCNYDGYDKSETVVEDGAFVGSDTMLIAPVRIGENAVIAAGSAIANDVPPDSLAIERAQQRNIEGWAKKRRDKKDQGG